MGSKNRLPAVDFARNYRETDIRKVVHQGN